MWLRIACSQYKFKFCADFPVYSQDFMKIDQVSCVCKATFFYLKKSEM